MGQGLGEFQYTQQTPHVVDSDPAGTISDAATKLHHTVPHAAGTSFQPAVPIQPLLPNGMSFDNAFHPGFQTSDLGEAYFPGQGSYSDMYPNGGVTAPGIYQPPPGHDYYMPVDPALGAHATVVGDGFEEALGEFVDFEAIAQFTHQAGGGNGAEMGDPQGPTDAWNGQGW